MSRAVVDLQRGNDGWIVPGGYMSYESSTIGTGGFTFVADTKPRRTIQFQTTTTGTCPVRLYLPHKRGLTITVVGSITGAVTPTVKREWIDYTMAGGELWTWTINWFPAV
jgi:hypothetical protein